MDRRPNQEAVNDAAKLIMHRLVARALSRNPALIERARSVNSQLAGRFHDQTFNREWDALLARPPHEVRSLLTSRSREMSRLRLSSPFGITDGIDFTDQKLRQRIWAAARRVAKRGDRSVRNAQRDDRAA